MEPLVTCNASHPDNKIVASIRRCDPGRASPTLTLAPRDHDRGRTCRSNFVGPDGTGIIVKANIRSLTGAVSDSRCPSVDPSHIRRGHI